MVCFRGLVLLFTIFSLLFFVICLLFGGVHFRGSLFQKHASCLLHAKFYIAWENAGWVTLYFVFYGGDRSTGGVQ